MNLKCSFTQFRVSQQHNNEDNSHLRYKAIILSFHFMFAHFVEAFAFIYNLACVCYV